MYALKQLQIPIPHSIFKMVQQADYILVLVQLFCGYTVISRENYSEVLLTISIIVNSASSVKILNYKALIFFL